MKLRPILRGVFWSLVGLTLVAHLFGGWYFSSVLIEDGFTPDPDPLVTPVGDFDLAATTYQSPLGEMDAFFLDAPGDLWVIHIHGKGATPAEGEHLFTPLQEAGYPQLAITYRNDDGQPLDPSGYYQYGATEWEDIKGAVEYAKANGAQGVVFMGYSTGAAHALSYAFGHYIDDIRGFVFDAPNVDVGDTVAFAASQREMPVLPMNVPVSVGWVAKVFTSLRIGVNWKSLDYVDRATESLRAPALVFHGTEDLTVPLSQSVAFVESSPDLVRLITVPGAGHVESYEVDPTTYVAEILNFLERLK